MSKTRVQPLAPSGDSDLIDLFWAKILACLKCPRWRTLVTGEPYNRARGGHSEHSSPTWISASVISLFLAKLFLLFLLCYEKFTKTSLTLWIETNLTFSWQYLVFSFDHICSRAPSQLYIRYRWCRCKDQVFVLAYSLLQWVKHMNKGIPNFIIDMDKHPWVKGTI